MTDRKRRPGRKPRETTRLGNTSGNPTTPSTPPEDLSSTIQDPDAPPRRPEASGALRGPELPRTAEGERDFSSMGRAEPQGADDARPARRRGFVPVREPSPPAPRFDLAPFRRDGSYDMQAIMVGGGEGGGRQAVVEFVGEVRRGGGGGGGEKKVAGGGGVDDVDEDDFYGASPVRPGPSNVLPAQKEDEKRKGKEKEQEKRPQDKKSDIAFGKPKSPKASPVKEQSSLWSKLFSRAQKTSPTKSEKYRKLAANETAQLTEKEKFDYWMKHELSSPRAVVADENEWQKEMELLYAREKHIAQLQQAKADASAMISQGDKESHERQELEEMISQCDLHLLEAEELEDKRQWRRSLQTSLGLETSPTFLAKFNDQLRDLNAKIEDDEKKERLRLKPWVDVSPDWAARLQKASDMTPSERAASSAGRGLHAPARPPGQLKQSSAEKALRVKWATEDSPHENELLEIQTYSDEMERDVAWGLAMRKRQSVLLARHKELSDLWTKQAEEMRADRESAWLESTGEKRIPISEPQSRAASMQQSKGLGEGTGGSGAGQYDILSDKQKQEKKDEEDEKNEMAREEAEGSKKMSRAEMKNAGRLGERRAGRQGIFNTSGLRQMPEMEPGPSSMRKRSMDVIPNPSETPASRSRKSTTPERPLSPFRATKAISPLQEGRQKPVFHVDSEVSEYLESLTQCRIRLEMQKKGVEMVDLDVMRKLVGTVAKPIVISVEGAAEDVAAMERRATRIREAKERLALAAKGEVERLREDEEKKRKKEEKEKEQGEGTEEAKDRVGTEEEGRGRYGG
ncbi:hypothetical protein EYC80_003424 [Monilinia laxa]|uniref:Uncharacterized protein n=1 Tax=Monilinia laxa TaxID=61186 RepID=A0A5N6KF10_MONLA|nr:hypothetical protein EYC80_003424 [Monilinia laxa]